MIALRNVLVLLLLLPTAHATAQQEQWRLAYDDPENGPSNQTTIGITDSLLATGAWQLGRLLASDRLQEVRYLSLRNAHLKQLNPDVSQLKSLRVLDLGYNDFKTLPESFSGLQNLEELYLDHDPNLDLEQAISVLSKLPNLRILHLDGVNKQSLPPSIAHLTQLNVLTLSDNNLEFLPEEICLLNDLCVLDLSGNPIARLPEGLSRLAHLQRVYVDQSRPAFLGYPRLMPRPSPEFALASTGQPMEEYRLKPLQSGYWSALTIPWRNSFSARKPASYLGIRGLPLIMYGQQPRNSALRIPLPRK